jgi:hypothetical protein
MESSVSRPMPLKNDSEILMSREKNGRKPRMTVTVTAQEAPEDSGELSTATDRQKVKTGH